MQTEHGTENTATASYSSVAYYYEQPSRFTRSDQLDIGDPRAERQHAYEVEPGSEVIALVSRFEGPFGDTDIRETGRAITRRSRFTMALPRGHEGVRLRRLYDQREPQSADVWVDGERAGTWHTASTNPERRWADADYLLPLELTRGKTSVAIEIRVISGTWTEYQYEIWGIE